MSQSHTLPEPTCSELADLVSRLARQLSQLEAAHAELRQQLGTEVRTRSITVVDEDGFERVIVAAPGQHGTVSVYGRAASGRSTCAELFANDPADGDGPHAGVSVTHDGEVVAVLEVLGGNPPHLHLER